MALRGTLTHRKIRRLGKILGIMPCFALGVVEALWHTTAEQAPAGDIGRMSNQDIADELFYDDDADALIDALLSAGLIDRSDEYRLVVHDWHDHADSYVHAWLAKRTLLFASGEMPKLSTDVFNGATRDRIRLEYHAKYPKLSKKVQTSPDESTEVHSIPYPVPCPYPVPSSLSCDGEGLNFDSQGDVEHEEEPVTDNNALRNASNRTVTIPKEKPVVDWVLYWDKFCDVYPPRVGGLEKPKAEEKFRKLLEKGEDPEIIIAGVTSYRQYCDREQKTRTSFVKQMTTFLNGRCWLEDYTTKAPPGSVPRRDMSPGDRARAQSKVLAALRGEQ